MNIVPKPGVSTQTRAMNRNILTKSWRFKQTHTQKSNNYRLSRNSDNNMKYVYDSSDIIRYRKERTINNNIHRIERNGGNSYDPDHVLTLTDSIPNNKFQTYKNGEIYHMLGKLQGSWDMINDIPISSGTNNDDTTLFHIHIMNESFSGSFKSSNSNNSTYFKITTDDIRFSNNYKIECMNIYKKNKLMFTNGYINPSIGDIFIVDINSKGNLALLKITDIDQYHSGGNSLNKGMMTFSYWKD
jgi:hypothetical protein